MLGRLQRRGALLTAGRNGNGPAAVDRIPIRSSNPAAVFPEDLKIGRGQVLVLLTVAEGRDSRVPSVMSG